MPTIISIDNILNSTNAVADKKNLAELLIPDSNNPQQALRIFEPNLIYSIKRGTWLRLSLQLTFNDYTLVPRERDLYKKRKENKPNKYQLYVWDCFKREEKLGKGSFGGVFPVTDTLKLTPDGDIVVRSHTYPRPNNPEKKMIPYALKEMKNNDPTSDNRLFHSVIQNEFEMLRKLQKEGYTVKLPTEVGSIATMVINQFIGNTLLYYLTQYPSTLSRRHPHLESISGLFEIFLLLANSLKKIHAEEIMHLDLKPENTIINIERIDGIDKITLLKIIDFGLSHLFPWAFPLVNGTLKYIAPEILPKKINNLSSFLPILNNDSDINPPELMLSDYRTDAKPRPTFASDIFSLGIMFGELWYYRDDLQFLPDEIKIPVINLIKMMQADQPDRPTLDQIINELTTIEKQYKLAMPKPENIVDEKSEELAELAMEINNLKLNIGDNYVLTQNPTNQAIEHKEKDGEVVFTIEETQNFTILENSDDDDETLDNQTEAIITIQEEQNFTILEKADNNDETLDEPPASAEKTLLNPAANVIHAPVNITNMLVSFFWKAKPTTTPDVNATIENGVPRASAGHH